MVQLGPNGGCIREVRSSEGSFGFWVTNSFCSDGGHNGHNPFFPSSLDPKDHIEGTPPPFCLAAVNGHLDAFAQFDFDDSEPIQFQLAQVSSNVIPLLILSRKFNQICLF